MSGGFDSDAPARRRWLQAFMFSLLALIQSWALARLYRRFIYDEATGRVFGLADDVYISACFGRSLFAGAGFVWYPGAPRVEGISNPLWSAMIGALHHLPGFSEDRLGLFVIGSNAALLLGLCALFVRSLMRSRDRAIACAAALLLSPGLLALAYWSAEGFEVALLALLALALIDRALCEPSRFDVGFFSGVLWLGLTTRMDFILLALPGLALWLVRRPSPRAIASLGAITSLGIALCLIARYAYYRALLPNTYYLKATGWPLSARIARGVQQNATALVLAALLVVTCCVPSIFHALNRRARPALACLLGFVLTVAYSTFVGGDSWGTRAGYDRFSVVGATLLVWGFAALLGSLERRHVAPVFVLALLSTFIPLIADQRGALLREGLFANRSPERPLEREWIRYGKAFKHVSEPGDRIAVCPAGAIVYFSHRGGVDLLGKVDPWVARLTVSERRPPENRCWRAAPGHNKEDDLGVFKLRHPEFSRYRPPFEQAKRYHKVKFEGLSFYARNATD